MICTRYSFLIIMIMLKIKKITVMLIIKNNSNVNKKNINNSIINYNKKKEQNS
jgi:hypothetical protein